MNKNKKEKFVYGLDLPSGDYAIRCINSYDWLKKFYKDLGNDLLKQFNCYKGPNAIIIPENNKVSVFTYLEANNIKLRNAVHTSIRWFVELVYKEADTNTKQFVTEKVEEVNVKIEEVNIKVEEVKNERRCSIRIQNKRDAKIDQVWAVISEIGSNQYKTIHRLINESLLGSIPEPLRKEWLKCSPKSGLLRRNCKYLNPRNFRNIPDEVHLYMYDILKSLKIIH